MRPRARRAAARGLLYVGAAVLVFQSAFPFLWMASTSMKPPVEVFAQPPYFVPKAPTWENFWRLFTSTNFLVYFRNSLTVAGLAVVLTMVAGAVGAYSLTRYRYPG
ncbi:MAG: carbohydrate ABC transporter permease, partial [Candidatus Rokubacteria bacterium]|nr:carbohydrate ABC transporter permease [Candidatus Rokubacteria bacterium]